MQQTESVRSMDLERIVLVPIFTILLCLSTIALFMRVGTPLNDGVALLMLVYRFLLVGYNLLLVVLLLARSDARAKSHSPLPRIAAYAGTFGPLLLGFLGGSVAPPALALFGVTLQALGMAFVVYSLTVLRRSFGVAPQVRTLVSRGPYRFIRHPLYVGEIVSLTGAVLVAPSWQKFLILAVTAALQVYRALQEEHLMSRHDEGYRRYMTATKRFVPGLL